MTYIQEGKGEKHMINLKRVGFGHPKRPYGWKRIDKSFLSPGSPEGYL